MEQELMGLIYKYENKLQELGIIPETISTDSEKLGESRVEFIENIKRTISLY